MRAAEHAALGYLSMRGSTSRPYVVLASDGLANCVPGSASTTLDDAAGAVMAVGAALDAGIPRDTTHANGWDYVDGRHHHARIYGPPCAQVIDGTTGAITLAFICHPGLG